jgi:hypothetical protein
MRNEIIYRGLRLNSSKSKYFQVKEGTINSLYENNNTLTLTYSPGSSAKSLSLSLGIPLVGPGNMTMESMSTPTRFSNPTITLNGLKLEKLTYDPHIINIVIVEDSESRVVQAYTHTIFVISKNDYRNPEFIKFLFYSGQLLYLKPVGPKISGYEIRNFPKIIVSNSDINLESENETYYSLRKRYDDYLIREIDYQDQFILEVRRILTNYGIELVRLNKERTLSTTSYVTYQFTQTPTLAHHPNRRDYDRDIISHKQPIEFTLHTPDMVLYHDFKNKYANVNLLSNLVEFKTTDKAGDRWTAAAKWSVITEDFNHTYQSDDNSNFAFQCQFRCELYFYEVIDTRYDFLQEIVTSLDTEDNYGGSAINESNTIKG